MLQTLPYTVDSTLLNEAQSSVPSVDSKLTINQPTGNFFYDSWEIKEEFKGTVWETLLNTLPLDIGEARIIVLGHGTTYMSHTDIDDRYHLSIKGQYSFLINVDDEKMYPTVADGQWYEMNTGLRHVAANFGSYDRVQLVIRKLLNKPTLENCTTVTIKPICENPRFEFDDLISPLLNKLNKQQLVNDFNILQDGVSFNLDTNAITRLDSIDRNKFNIQLCET
jgi:hypothetical protein